MHPHVAVHSTAHLTTRPNEARPRLRRAYISPYIYAEQGVRFLAHDNALDLGVISHTFRAAAAAAAAAAERVGAPPLSAAERAAAARFAALPRRLRGGGLPEEAAAAEGGGLREWGGAAAARPEADLGHRHFSHLYALFPGEDVGPVDTPRLARAARRALERRLRHGGGHTGWSAAWAAALWARLHEGGAAHAALRVLLHEFSSTALLGLHPPLSPAQADNGGGRCATCVKRRGGAREGIFQLDANAGAAAGSTSSSWQRQPSWLQRSATAKLGPAVPARCLLEELSRALASLRLVIQAPPPPLLRCCCR